MKNQIYKTKENKHNIPHTGTTATKNNHKERAICHEEK